METWDVRIISASSTQDGDEPVIELFGKTRDRESITILAYGFRPYLFAVDPKEELEQQLKEDSEVISVEHDRLLYKSEMHEVLKVTIKSPWKISEYRTRF
ncbi:MAG: DNA polymerase II, partial [Candidatus Methanomethylophilaceae archaeon]|nr:DNA polymerase II [Candidatus Methanomethylophilaceae archaeon]